MSFVDWLFSNYPESSKVQAWGLGHILTMIGCVMLIVVLALLFGKRSLKARRIVIWVLVGTLIALELTRRIINLINTSDYSLQHILGIILPRPWCAISSFSVIIAAICNRKFFYNFASISALLCAIIFFAYPGVGFRAPYFLFEDLYSVSTHCLLLVISITYITLHFTDFDYKQFWKVAICYAVIVAYSFLEIYVLQIEADPMYFLPNNDVQDILSVSYQAYLPIYITFTIFFYNLFPFVQWLKNKISRSRNKQIK